MSFAVGSLVRARGREWVVLPESEDEMLLVRPLGGASDETAGILLPLEKVEPATFDLPDPSDVGDYQSCRLLRDALRLGFRSSAGPFRSFASIAVDPRPYQLVPLLMAMKLDPVRLLIADDVGIGKTVEAGLVAKELLDRGEVERMAVLCPPHLAEQWQKELVDKFHIQAELVLPSTVKRLERPCRLGESLFEYHPFVVVSTEFIKSDRRRDEFARTCPELVIVDEAHTCSWGGEGRGGRKQRFDLISAVAKDPERHIIFVTATPHSGKENEFRSLLGLVDSSLGSLPDDLSGPQSANQRRRLAEHFVQRRRADIKSYLDSQTPFPEREDTEESYRLSPAYEAFVHRVVRYAREVIADKSGTRFHQRVRWWSALALLRSIASSPAAAAATLRSRAACADADTESEVDLIGRKTVMDLIADDSSETPDVAPGSDSSGDDIDDKRNRSRLLELAREADKLVGKEDHKLVRAAELVKTIVADGFNPIIFCRFIPTAEYVAEGLRKALPNSVEVAAVTGLLPPEEREERVAQLGEADRRVLVCTDCLSEGINLQKHFTAVLHYDLPRNPNRLEQREGRVDRFGQTAEEVKACLLYGADNPIDGIVLDVLLRKVREIKRATGINVPFPEDSQSIIDTITQALLLNPDRHIAAKRRTDKDQLTFDFGQFDEAEIAKLNVTRKVDEAAEREKASRSIFAQHAIKAQEIEADLHEVDEAIGDPKAVEEFVTTALNNLFGVQVIKDKAGYRIVTANLPEALRGILNSGEIVNVSFQSPTPEGYLYLGRNHRFVEQLCQLIMANTVNRVDKRAARTAVIRTRQVAIKTTILLFRCRNVIEDRKGHTQVVAEEMILWGWRGTPQQKEYLDHEAAWELLSAARASSDMSLQARSSFLDNELKLLKDFTTEFDSVAENQSKKLVDAHERFSALMDGKRFQVVYPVLPMDLLGVYVLLPDGGQTGGAL